MLPDNSPVLIMEGSRVFELGEFHIPKDQPPQFVLSTKMTKYRIVWLGGKIEFIKGADLVDALTQSGYGAGAVQALDTYEEVKETISGDMTGCSQQTKCDNKRGD